MISNKISRWWAKASPRARQKALVQRDTVMQVERAKLLRRALKDNSGDMK
jgi:hypothetical protein